MVVVVPTVATETATPAMIVTPVAAINAVTGGMGAVTTTHTF